MKTSTISSMSIQNAIRYTRMKAQEDLSNATKEATTGRFADIGAALGAKTSRSVDLNGEVLRLANLKTTNSLATARLGASQEALANMSKNGQTILNTLVALGNNSDASTIKTASTTMAGAFASFTSLANTSVNGEYLFAGINTDVKPLNDYNDPATPNAKTAVTTALNTFLAAQAPPLTDVGQMNAAQMNDFIDNTLTPMFTGASWTTDWSQATDQNMTSRVDRSEVIETSTNANTAGFRNMALVGVIAQELLSKGLSGDARKAASDQAIKIAGLAISGIDQQRTRLGLSEERITTVNETLDAQKTIIEKHLGDLEGVDGYEASTRVNLLKALVENSYTLTTQLIKMSLADYLK